MVNGQAQRGNEVVTVDVQVTRPACNLPRASWLYQPDQIDELVVEIRPSRSGPLCVVIAGSIMTATND
jgi:hypothetical protein